MLLEIDLKALAELVELLLHCYIKAGKSTEFPAVLERLRSNINDPRWQRKVTYFHALHALLPDWDEREGRRELRKLGSVKEVTDVETLQLYLDLFGNELTFSETIELIDRILVFAENDTDRLHYSGTKAIQYLAIGDQIKAAQELDAALSTYKRSEKGRDTSTYALYRVAMSLELLGSIRRDMELLDEAIQVYEQLLQREDWTPTGQANILRGLGDTYRYKGAWPKARDAYTRALASQPLGILKVFLAECLLHLEGWERAVSEISSIEVASLSAPEYTDYVFALAAISVESDDVKRLKEAEGLLRGLELSSPYFKERRDTLLLSLLDAQRSGRSSSITQAARRAMAGIGATALRYVKLEPNFMGVGINLGKMLDDLARAADKHSSDSTQKRDRQNTE
jgi:tetratricopeptide (TPR) repeat protein